MPTHTRSDETETERNEANFYPVDGIRGTCKCGNFIQYIAMEGDTTCESCGRTWNVYVDHEQW
jgi:hypothetical protein